MECLHVHAVQAVPTTEIILSHRKGLYSKVFLYMYSPKDYGQGIKLVSYQIKQLYIYKTRSRVLATLARDRKMKDEVCTSDN